MSDEIKSILVIADVYKLSRTGNKFDKDIKKGTRKFKNHSIERAWCDEMNARWEITGTWCVIDEDLTESNNKQIKASAKVRRENDEARLTAGKAVAALALGANKANPVKDTTPEVNEELQEAFAEYEEVFGESAHPRSGLKGLNEKIAAERKRLAELDN